MLRYQGLQASTELPRYQHTLETDDRAGIDHNMAIGEKWYRETIMVGNPGPAKLLAMVKDGGVKNTAYDSA